MNGRKVFYLPPPASLTDAPRRPESSRAWRWRTAWWRLCVAFAEVRTILRARPRPAALDSTLLLDRDASARLAGSAAVAAAPAYLAEDEPRPRRRPALVIDFETARLRLRPALQEGV